MFTGFTFVAIRARYSVPFVALFASAPGTTGRLYFLTNCIGMTPIISDNTFWRADSSISLEASFTITSVTAQCIGTYCFFVTFVKTGGTFLHIITCSSISDKASLASTAETSCIGSTLFEFPGKSSGCASERIAKKINLTLGGSLVVPLLITGVCDDS